MSGFSNRWGWGYTPKTVVEDCLVLDVYMLWQKLVRDGFDQHKDTTGILQITRGRWAKLQSVYSVRWVNGLPVLTLHTLHQTITTTTTRPYFGGVRYWWGCPRCGNRCKKLYLPPGARQFACRGCHNLTYASAQEARKLPGHIGALAGVIENMQRVEHIDKKLSRAQPGSNRHEYLLQLRDKYTDRAVGYSQEANKYID